jgi:hypothetical protein
MAIRMLAESMSVEEGREWVKWVSERADTAAVDGSHEDDPRQFLSNVYSMAISSVAESMSVEDAREWIDTIYEEVERSASSDTHDVASETFVADCCGRSLARVTPDTPAVDSEWHRAVLAHSLQTTPQSALDRFYARYHVAVTRVDVSLGWLSWIVSDCFERTISATSPVTDDPHELAAQVTADTLFGPAANSDDRLATVPDLPDTVAQLVTDDPTAFATLLDRVAAIYAERDVSEFVVTDPDATDFAAVRQDVLAWVRGRALVDALTDPATPEHVVADIREAAVETAREFDEPDRPLARYYLVALVGLAAKEDPAEATRHDELLDEALRRESVDSLGFCLVYFNALPDADDYLPVAAVNPDSIAWRRHLVDHLLSRAESDFDGLPDDPDATGDAIAGMTAAVADDLYPADGPRREFHTLLDTVAAHDTDAAVTQRVIQRVPELLGEEYANLLAQWDWEDRFESVV